MSRGRTSPALPKVHPSKGYTKLTLSGDAYTAMYCKTRTGVLGWTHGVTGNCQPIYEGFSFPEAVIIDLIAAADHDVQMIFVVTL